MMQWLALSIVASVVLTIVLNVALRLFPGASDRLEREVADLASPTRSNRTDDSRVRVVVPWRAMLLVSLILTVVVNAWLWLS